MNENDLNRLVREVDGQLKLLAGCVEGLALIEAAKGDQAQLDAERAAASMVNQLPSDLRKGARQILSDITNIRARLTRPTQEIP